jgi:sugar phosphate isomerase/epimerase
LIRDNGLDIVSLVRGGFFPDVSAQKRMVAIDENKRAIDESAELGSPMVVLVCGADPGQPLEVSRSQIRDGIEAILPYAKERNVKLSVEPLHPMYADTRSAINTLEQANDLVEAISDSELGVAIDVYHLWWDPMLRKEIVRCGEHNNIFAFHICDWLSPTNDMLTDRGLMGAGCIPVREIREWVENAGFTGYVEVEIFSEKWWAEDQYYFLEEIKKAYLEFS